jgi:hypothetical protein
MDFANECYLSCAFRHEVGDEIERGYDHKKPKNTIKYHRNVIWTSTYYLITSCILPLLAYLYYYDEKLSSDITDIWLLIGFILIGFICLEIIWHCIVTFKSVNIIHVTFPKLIPILLFWWLLMGFFVALFAMNHSNVCIRNLFFIDFPHFIIITVFLEIM